MARRKFGGKTITSILWTATLIAGTASAQPSSSDEASIVVAPFEVRGEATAALAESMRSDLAATLDLDPCVAARTDREGSERSSNYVLRGSAYAEGGRAFVALQLVNATTTEPLWFENYDYRGITAEMMGRDILKFLKAIAPDAVLSRIRSGCSDR
jgi:TolB-like protein